MKIKNIIFTIIRILLVVALIGAIVFFIFLKKTESKVDFATVKTAVANSIHSDRMEESTGRFLKKYYGLNPEDYEGVLLFAPVSNMDAEEVLLIKCKNSEQSASLEDVITERQQTKEHTYEGYAPEQYALCQNYILDNQGNYIIFIVSPEAGKIDAAFKESLKE